MNDHDTNTDKTVPAQSVPHVSSGTYNQGDPLLRSGMMLPPQAPGALGMIGKYQVVRILGEGGMGQVLLAREPVTDSLVAIKMIKPEFLNKGWAVHRFLTEARHMYKMSHPAIIRVLDVSDRAEGPYFVMPYMSGGSLADKIKPGEPLPSQTILPIASAVAEALQHAHSHGITHRDLKPSNILLDGEGRSHLADFGLLRTFHNDTIIDAGQPQIEGTVPYMSPAVAAGKAEDTRCDIYSFGCLLYEMLTGQPPYQGPSVDAILKQIQDAPPPPIRQLNHNAPANLTAIADHAMARELRDRYASMGDVVADLDRAAHGKEPIGPHGHEKAAPNKHKALATAGVVVLIGLAAFGLSKLPALKLDGKARVGNNTQPNIITVNPVSERTPGEEMVIYLPHGVTMKLVWIPATTSEAWRKISNGSDYFLMGSPPEEKGRDGNENQVDVKLSHGFWLAQTECTQAQWVAVMGNNPSQLKGDDLPVEQVSWVDVQKFITRLNQAKTVPTGWKAAMPTEAQWEYACRAGTKTAYSFGETFNAKQANFRPNLGKRSAVASCAANAWGLYDMHGNVWEWCADWYAEKLPGGTDPTGSTSGLCRAFRGGGWNLSDVLFCRAAIRNSGSVLDSNGAPDDRNENVGFRMALIEVPGVPAPQVPTPAPPVQGPFSYTVTDGAVTLVKYTGSGGDLIIPDKLNELPVTAIGPGAFTGCTKLTGLTIPATVTSIAKEAFSGCTSLVSVNFKGNAPGGGADASVFSGDDQANVYYLPGTTGWAATFGGRSAFLQVQDYNCMIENGVITIAKYTGPGGNVIIPDKINGMPVTTIGTWSFQNGGLTNVTIPGSVTSIGLCAFEGCGLTNVTISASVTSMGENPFGANSDLLSISVDTANPAFISGTDGVVFSKDKTKLIAYPAGKAGSYAIPEGVTRVMGRAFLGSSKLSGVTIPASVTNIEWFAFSCCEGLTTITIPDSITTIDAVMFENAAGLTTVVVGKSVAKIGNVAFRGCRNLSSIYFKGNAPSLDSEVFAGADKVTIYYLPTTTGWGKDFGGRPTAVWDPKLTGTPVAPGASVPEPAKDLTFNIDGVKFEFVLIRPGSFTMGSGKAAHKVTLTKPFYLGKYEVTQEQWEKLMGNNPSNFKGAKNPVERVSWNACQGFVAKLNEKVPGQSFRLPTEAEWEYACRAGSTGDYCYGDGDLPLAEYAWYSDNSGSMTHPVGGKKPNAWGLYDMHGNVWEWCADWYGDYLTAATSDPQGPSSGSDRVGRGGSWSYGACDCRVANRNFINPADSHPRLGFRVAAVSTSAPAGTSTAATPQNQFSCTVKDGTVTITKYTGPGGGVIIPDKINGLPVTAIAGGAFSGPSLTSLTIPAGVTSIDKEAFSGCTSLASVYFKGNAPGGADASVFSGDDNVNVYYLPGTTGWAATFGGRPALLQVQDYNCVIENGVVIIAKYTGPGGDVDIPDKIEGRSVTGIGGYAFQKCTSLTHITIPDTVNSISFGAFSECSNLTNVTIPNSVTDILNYAFLWCSRLTSVTLPRSITTIGAAPFAGCAKLVSITVDAANPVYSSGEDGIVFNKEKTKLVCYPSGRGGSYEIPAGVTDIEGYALQHCTTLTSVTIPESVTHIAEWAFSDDPILTGIYFKGNAPILDSAVFANADKATIYYLPNTTGWGKEFGGRPTAVWEPRAR